MLSLAKLTNRCSLAWGTIHLHACASSRLSRARQIGETPCNVQGWGAENHLEWLCWCCGESIREGSLSRIGIRVLGKFPDQLDNRAC